MIAGLVFCIPDVMPLLDAAMLCTYHLIQVVSVTPLPRGSQTGGTRNEGHETAVRVKQKLPSFDLL